MTSKLRASSLILFAIGLPLGGCMVSFQDYPLASGGSSGAGTVTANAGDSSSAGSNAAGSTSSGGDDSGSANGGSASGGIDQGGSAGSAPGGAGDVGGIGGVGGVGGIGMPPSNLIDDFEDGDAQLLLLGGRDGSWFVTNDGHGQQTPPPNGPTLPSLLMPPRGLSTRAMHTTGSGFSVWGAALGVNFLSGMMPPPYDISMYQGLTFAVKLGKETAVKPMRVSIADYDTTYGCKTCGDHFGVNVNVGDAFATVQVPFLSFKQLGFGTPVRAFDPTRTYTVYFSWTQNQTFDVWIDDLSFY
ncbi:MAG TPA: hypothetical protein VHV51_03165 [Polyangiaceae bacterium]|jgi:hypothetical protein|nr:hypothetical protein [Polyangiaceae bacterium]